MTPIRRLVGVGSLRAGKFNIAISADGMLTFKAKPDFEKPGGRQQVTTYMK